MVTLSTTTGSTAPAPDQYEIEFVKNSDIRQMPDYEDPNKMVNKIFLTFRIENFNYDPDVDDQDYNGHEFDVLYTASLHKRSNLSTVVAALLGVTKDELAAMGDVELDALKGRRVNATLDRTPGGYAKITAATPIRKKKKAAKPEPAEDENIFLKDDDDDE